MLEEERERDSEREAYWLKCFGVRGAANPSINHRTSRIRARRPPIDCHFPWQTAYRLTEPYNPRCAHW
jgi:hypothetical protein